MAAVETANLRIADPYHGIEKSGATEAINNMLVQSDQGVVDLFPVWPAGKDASFYHLLVPGAFDVSSATHNGTVGYADITSNAGQRLQLKNPWPGHQIAVTDQHGHTVRLAASNGVVAFDTVKGGTYHLVPLAAGPAR